MGRILSIGNHLAQLTRDQYPWCCWSSSPPAPSGSSSSSAASSRSRCRCCLRCSSSSFAPSNLPTCLCLRVSTECWEGWCLAGPDRLPDLTKFRRTGKNEDSWWIKFLIKKTSGHGGSPGPVVMGCDSHSKGCGFEFKHCMLDGHFFTTIS